MSFKALVYVYVLGGLTFIPLLICAAVAWTIYTSVPVGDPDPAKLERKKLADKSKQDDDDAAGLLNDQARPRKAWLTVRRTFEEKETDGSYVNMMRTFLDSRSKDPKRSRPKDMWYVVLKGNVLYLYEDESMTECEAAIQVSAHEVIVYPEGLNDGELFTKRNAICLKPVKSADDHDSELISVTREMGLEAEDVDKKVAELNVSDRKKEKERAKLEEVERIKAEVKAEALDSSTPWFIFVRSCVEMEDWYTSLVHAANYSNSSSTLEPIRPVFSPADMDHLVATLDEQPDVIPMRWLNALLGRIFFSFYRTKTLESFIIGRLMKKLSKVKMPSFLHDVSVTEVSVGKTPPTLSKPMLKDLTKEGDAALEIRVMYRGEIRLTVEATAIINLGQRFKTYTVKLVLAVVLRRLDGNLLVKVKRPPTNRLWYAFTQPPEMDLDVEPVVSDRQIKWGMICSTIESRLKEVINESVVLPNMDDIAFFETSQYLHRGGIWADASRKAGTGSDSPEGTPGQNGPIIDANGDMPVKSHSIDVRIDTSPTAPSEPVVNDRSETASAPPLLQDQMQRRSWFSNVSGGDSSLVEDEDESTDSNRPDQLLASDDDRGRPLSVDTIARRATSVPASKGSPGDGAEATEDASLQGGSTLSPPESLQETTSGHSRIRSLSSGASILGSEQARSSRESLTTRGTNTSSFLSTLKQKADKQALSNTAKEAMKKWSANWNGFKRDRLGGSTNGEEAADSVPQLSDTPPSARSRNFADVQAAVAERKGRESLEGTPQADSPPSIPMDVPNRRGESSKSHTRRSSTGSNKDFEPSTSISPQSSPRGPSLLRKEAARATISPPSLTTDTHSIEGTPAASSSFLPSPEPPVQAPPIKTQPSQGAVMMIPGIHVSHRNDIQSYGYVPPSPTPSEGKPRTATIPPAMQSMYKLFRSPTSNSSVSQQQDQARASQASTSSDISADSPRRSEEPPSVPDANGDVTPLMLSVPDTSGANTPTTSKPTPPPLPPRATHSPPPQASPVPPPLPARREAEVTSPTTVEIEVSTTQSASDALRHIAEQDETKRKDIEASPELRPKAHAAKGKRTSLGARRITSAIIISEEPEPLREDPEGRQDGRTTSQVNEMPMLHTGAGLRPGDQTEELTLDTQAPEASALGKPKPPPLPPRRSSTATLGSS